MVEREIRVKNSDYSCNVSVDASGDKAKEAATLELTNCSAKVKEKEPLISGFERGQVINIGVFKVKTFPTVIDRTSFISFGGSKAASLAMRFNREGNMRNNDTLDVMHLEVDETERRKGLGEMLMNIIYAYALALEAEVLHMMVGGGRDTADFFISQGIPREDVNVNEKGNLATVKTRVSKIEYNEERIGFVT